jgi:hypothetical protein
MTTQILAIALSALVLIGWACKMFANRKERMFEFKFDETQSIAQLVISIKSSKINGVYLQHPDETWDRVNAILSKE